MPNSKLKLTSETGEGPNPDSVARRQTEESARKERDFSAAILDTAGALIVVLDKEGRITRFNRACEAVTGYSAAEVVGKIFWEFLILPEELPGIRQAWEAIQAGDFPNEHQNHWVAKDGSRRLIAWSNTAIVTPQKAVECVIATGMDITRHQLAEVVLREQEEDFRALAEAVPQIVWATRPDGWNIYFNQQWVDYTGMTMEESYGHGWNKPFHPDDKQRAWEAWQRATQHNERYSLECRLRRADGIYRWWLIRGAPVRSAKGEIQKWFGTCTDIEEIKQAEVALQQAHDTLEQRVTERTEQLQQSEALLRGITDSSPDPIFLKDRAGRMLLANPATLAALQKRAQDVLGKTDEEIYDDPAVGRLMMANDRRVMESGQTEVIEEVVPSPTGPRTFLSAKTPYRDAEGHVIGLIGIARDITKRKRAEEALRLSEEKFAQAFASNPAAVTITRLADGLFLDVNDTWVKFTGYSREEAIGHSAQALSIWPGAAGRDRFVASLTEFGSVRGWEQEFRMKSGETFVAQMAAQLLTTAGEQVVLSTLVDITARKQAEAALRGSEERLRALSDSMPQLAWMAHADGFIHWYNRRWYEYTGTTPAQMEGWGWQSVHDPQALPQVLQQWKEALSAGKPFEMVFPLRGADGRFRRFLTRAQPLKDAEGKVLHWFGTNTDVDELKRIEEALASQREELQLILDSAPALIFYKDRENRFLRVNRAFAERMGMPKEQLEGRSLFEIYPREQAEGYWRDDQEVLASGQPKTNIVEPMQGLEGQRWLQTGKVLCRDAQGNIIGVIGFSLDITERKQAEEALRATNDELTRFNNAMIGRELRMIELKQEINALCAQLAQPPRYGAEFADQAQPEL